LNVIGVLVLLFEVALIGRGGAPGRARAGRSTPQDNQMQKERGHAVHVHAAVVGGHAGVVGGDRAAERQHADHGGQAAAQANETAGHSSVIDTR
jgi:hypothetical protein